ncbi:MAG: hypothetical protein M3N98_08165 [Actinomycetota bacterium]|nr:hypothetical protein [Actinomycetota bacterium]
MSCTTWWSAWGPLVGDATVHFIVSDGSVLRIVAAVVILAVVGPFVEELIGCGPGPHRPGPHLPAHRPGR